MLQQTDTRFPVYLPPDEWDTKSFHHWMQRFASCCLNSVVRYAFCTRGTTDKTLLELDRKIRSFPVSLRPPESVMGTAGTSAESSVCGSNGSSSGMSGGERLGSVLNGSSSAADGTEG